MSVRFRTYLICDGAGCHKPSPAAMVTQQTPGADDWSSLRVSSQRSGWTRKRVNGRIGDFCLDCSAFLSDVPDYRAAG